jgi:hypothetical protein
MLWLVSRKCVAGLLVSALPVAALLGLVLHAHPDDHNTDHHAAHVIHAHFGGHEQGHHEARRDGHPVYDDADDHDRAVYFESFVGEATASFVIAAAVPLEIDIPTPEVQAAQPPVQVVHGHDPPLCSQLAPRAPPSFLS